MPCSTVASGSASSSGYALCPEGVIDCRSLVHEGRRSNLVVLKVEDDDLALVEHAIFSFTLDVDKGDCSLLRGEDISEGELQSSASFFATILQKAKISSGPV